MALPKKTKKNLYSNILNNFKNSILKKKIGKINFVPKVCSDFGVSAL